MSTFKAALESITNDLLDANGEPIKDKFNRSMSHAGRKLLEFMFELTKATVNKQFKTYTEYMTFFGEVYDPFIYDNLANQFDIATFMGKMQAPKSSRPDLYGGKTVTTISVDELRSILKLEFFDEDFAGAYKINKYSNPPMSLFGCKEVYTWISVKFARSDFDHTALPKIVEMSREIDDSVSPGLPSGIEQRIENLKKVAAANKVDGNIHFLYKNYQESLQSSTNAREKWQRQAEKNNQKLDAMYKLAGDTTHKVKHAFNAQDYEAIEAQRREANKTDTDRLYETLWSQAEARLNVAPTMPPWFASPEEWLKNQCLNGITDYNRPVPPLNTLTS